MGGFGKIAIGRSLLLGLVRARLVSFGVVLGLGFMLLASLALSAVLAALYQQVAIYLRGARLRRARLAPGRRGRG